MTYTMDPITLEYILLEEPQIIEADEPIIVEKEDHPTSERTLALFMTSEEREFYRVIERKT